MKKLYSLAIASLLSVICNSAQNALFAQSPQYQWAKSIGSTSDDYGCSIATDDSGNVYITGYFQSTADFDPGAGIVNLTSAGVEDIFISKLDASGNFVWAKAMGGTGNDRGYSIAVDASGNVYTTGYFSGTADFDPGAGIVNLTSAGGYDIFISKLDASGNFVWAKSMGGTVYDLGYSIAADASGNVYTTGFFSGTADFDPGAGIVNLTSAGTDDIFISKLDASGNFVWAKSMGGTGGDYSYSIATDASGNVYTTGFFSGTADFDPGAGIVNLTSAGTDDIFISKLDASGNFVWAKSMGGAGNDYGNSIAVDVSGNVYTTGYFEGAADFDPGAGIVNLTSVAYRDIFISKLDASGNFLWAKSMGGTFNDYGSSIAVDTSGNVYTTGYFDGTADFDPGAGIVNLTSAAGSVDIFISKLDASGNFLWAKSMGGAGNDYGNSIAVDASGNVYTTGNFFGTADFDPGAGVVNLTSNGGNDIFAAKYSAGTSINLDSGLVAHYPFNGNANDESGNGNNGTVNGATLSTDRFGNANKAYNFNGTSNNIDLGSGNTLNLTDSITISLWINMQNYQSSPVIINRRVSSPSLHDQYGLSMVNGKVYWTMQYATSANSFIINASQDVSLNAWHHFVGKFDGTNALLFVDDSMVASTTVSTMPTGGFGNTVIGSLIASGQYYFEGIIDDVRIYGRGLNSMEIDSLFHEGGWPLQQSVNLDSGLVAHYPFNGNANDESGNNYHGTVNGATLSTDRFGNANTAYMFNGSSDYILVDTIPSVNFGTGDFALSTWIKANTTQLTYPMVLSTRSVSLDGFLHGLFNNGVFFYQDVSNTFLSTGNDLKDNLWHHLVTVRDNNTLTLYLDGVSTSSGPSTNNITSPNKLYIGWDIGNPTLTYFNGLIDDIRIYGRGLNSMEIDSLFHQGGWPLPPSVNLDSGLVAYYPFNGNANDESGNGNNGTVNGAILTTDRFGSVNKAYSFDGTSSNITVSNSSTLNINGHTSISISAWINVASGFNTTGGVFCKWGPGGVVDDQFSFGVQNDNFYFMLSDGSTYTQPAAFTYQFNQNYLVTGIFDAMDDSLKIYVNEVLMASGYFNNYSIQNTSQFIEIGSTANVDFFKGTIDDIRIYNRALNDSEISAIYMQGYPYEYVIPNFSASTVCFGDSTQFTDLSNGSDTITSWQWNFGDTASGSANSSTLQNPKHLFTNSGVYNITLIASGNSASDTITKQVVVNALPQANAGTDKTICEGSGVYLYATGGNSYLWFPSVGLNCTNCQQPYASPADTASYIVTVTNANQCTATDTVTVNVASIPSPAITPPGDTICQGNSTTLDAGAGYTTYSWSSGQNTQTVSVSQPGWYYVWVTNSAGCWGQSPSVYVGIKSNVTVTVSPSSTVCEGEIISLSASGGFLTYQWSDGSTGQNISVISSGIYTVTATDGVNCNMVSSPVSVTVKDTNITPQVFIYGDTSFCDGGYVWLEAQSGFTFYQWSNGVNTNWNYITLSGTFDVTVTDMCGSYVSLPVTITEYSKPNPTLNASGSTNLCQGQNVTLTAPGGYSYYYWPQTGTSLQSILVTYEGDYFCWVQDANGCWGASDTMSVTVGPDVYITPAGSSTLCDGNSLTVTANGTNIVSYQWSSGETTQSINATVTGVYNVTVTDNNSCTGAAPYPLTLTVLDTNPVPVILMAYNDSILCQGEYVYLYTDCNYQQYQWSNNVNTCGQYVNQGGNYIVTVNNGCGTGISAPVSISVNALPLVSAGNDATICGGQSTTLSASGGVSYQWYPSYGLTCTNCQGPVASPAYTTTYSVYGTDAAGCGGWDNVTVYVEPASVSFSASPTVQYLPDDPGTVYFTYTGSTVNITAYLWDFGDGNQSTSVNPVHTYTTKGWYDISLTVTNNSGCSTTITYYEYILIEQIFPATSLNTGTNNNINDVSFISGYNGWNAMSDGNVLITNDGGVTWTTGYVNAGVPLWGIYLIGNAGYVVGDNGFISVSYDGGVSWSNFTTGVLSALYDVYLSSLNYGFAVGANGTILQYNGTAWTTVNLGITVDLNGVYTYGLFTYIVGDGGFIWRYDGFSWDTLVTNVTVDLNSIYFINNLIGYAAGEGGTILMTSDGGVTWTTVFSGITSSFTSVAPVTGDSVIAVGADGIVYLSINGGLNWGRYSIGDNRLLYGVSVVNDGWGGFTGYIAGAAGGVFKFEKTVVTPVEQPLVAVGGEADIHSYPNPVTDILIISIANFKLQTLPNGRQVANCKIFDIIGQEVMNVSLKGESTAINCEGLDPGMYFIWITAEEKVATGRFMIAD